MTSRPWVSGAVATIAVAAVGVALLIDRGSGDPGTRSARSEASPSTAVVQRRDLVSSQFIAGTLGYQPQPPLSNQLAGIYTWLPPAGAVIRPGRVLYRVDSEPAILMRGSTPAWRTLAPGVLPGPDVTQLNRALEAFGYFDGSGSSPQDSYGLATEIAVERWQRALGVPITGTVALGQVVFRPGSVRVGAALAAVGVAASPGAQPYQVTGSQRAVTANLDAADASEAPPGASVTIQLFSGRTVPGRIAAVAQVITGSQSAPSIVVTVTPSAAVDVGGVARAPVQVALTTAVARHVLAVPVTALLALAGGGYGLEVVTSRGPSRLVAVRTGAFSTGMVQIGGPGIQPGTRVVISQ